MFSRTVKQKASELLIFTGPHGSGKDTLEDLFTKSNRHAVRLVRYTTRRQAPDEVNGHTYHFISAGQFRQMSKKGDFIEETDCPEGSTGTSLSDTMALLRQYQYICLTVSFEDALILKGRLDALAIANRCFFVGPCSEKVMIDNPDKYAEALSASMLQRQRGTDDIALHLREARLYREMYLAHRGGIEYIANAKQSVALRQIKRTLRR